MTADPQLSKLLAEMLAGTADMEQVFDFHEMPLESVEDVRQICDALASVAQRPDLVEDGELIDDLAAFFLQVANEEVVLAFREQGLPLLRELSRRKLQETPPDSETVMFLMKVFALYADAEGLAPLLALARDPDYNEHYLWPVISETFAQDGHPLVEWIASELREPLPAGMAGIGYLDLVNELMLRREIEKHPYDTEPGWELLRGWLGIEDEDLSQHVGSAATALAFVHPPDRDALIEQATMHEDYNVRMQAAWVEARLGRERGIAFLAEAAADPLYARTAINYLQMLGHEDRIPEVCGNSRFQAEVELIEYLSDPEAMGIVPDQLELLDTRELDWPPTEDRRQFWIFKFSVGQGEEAVTSYALVGSETESLFDDYSENPTPEEIYALHCSWEMDGEPNLDRGRELLGGQV